MRLSPLTKDITAEIADVNRAPPCQVAGSNRSTPRRDPNMETLHGAIVG